MKQFVVTLGRQFGSMGRSIARALSEELGVEYYDRDIVEQVTRELGITREEVDLAEGRLGNSTFWRRAFPLGRDVAMQDQIFAAQARIISTLAERQSCIIVGRCADYILRREPNRLAVFVFAPEQARLDNCTQRLNMTLPEAKKMMKSVDAARKSYHKKYTGYDPGELDQYDLLINSAVLGIEGTAAYLAQLVRLRFG